MAGGMSFPHLDFAGAAGLEFQWSPLGIASSVLVILSSSDSQASEKTDLPTDLTPTLHNPAAPLPIDEICTQLMHHGRRPH